MKRWTWGILLSILAIIGCGRQAAHQQAAAKANPTAAAHANQPAAADSKDVDAVPVDKFDIGDPPDDPTDLKAETLAANKAAKARTEEYNDNSPTFQHRGDGTPDTAKKSAFGKLGDVDIPERRRGGKGDRQGRRRRRLRLRRPRQRAPERTSWAVPAAGAAPRKIPPLAATADSMSRPGARGPK